MVLQVRPVKVEDAPALTTVHFEATSSNDLTQLLYGNVDQAELKSFMERAFERELKEVSPLSSPDRYMVVIDTDYDDGQPISWAHWQVPMDTDISEPGQPADLLEGFDTDPTDETTVQGATEPRDEKPSYPQGLNVSLQEAFMKQINALRERVLKGQKHFILKNLATHPSHERRGAASMLLQWPFEMADEEGTVCYLDTALDGPSLKLYERHGFVMVDRCQLDLKGFGGDHVHTHVGMIRELKGHR